jgi:hypothetical protein
MPPFPARWFLARLFSTLKMEVILSSEMSVHILHGSVSQKMATFITTTVRTSNPAI